MQSTNGSVASLNDWESMFCWHPTREEFHQWLDSDLREFTKKENRSPRLTTEAWLEKHIASDIHAIFFVTYGNELFDWLSKLTDRNTFKKKRNIVWTPELIQTVQNLDNPITRAVDFWLTSVLEGYVTEFAVDQRKRFSASKRYFFKGYRGKYLGSLNLSLKMLLYEKGTMDLVSDE